MTNGRSQEPNTSNPPSRQSYNVIASQTQRLEGVCKETSLMGVFGACAACSARTITSITAILVTLVTYATFTHRTVGKISNPASVHQKRRLNTKRKNVLAIHIQSLQKV